MRYNFPPKKEIQLYAILFCFMGLFLFAAVVVSLPMYLKWKSKGGQPVTFSAEAYDGLLFFLRHSFFGFIPALGTIFLASGLRILRIVKRIPEMAEIKKA